MLRPRIIPCLLIRNGGLVKTIKFSNDKYIGDPLNAVRIFNEKEVDELIIIDIDASAMGREPNYELISKISGECSMPICYGGGIKTVEQIEKIIQLGVEKVALGSAVITTPDLISKSAKRVGSQSIVAVMDVMASCGDDQPYEIAIMNGKKLTGITPELFARKVELLGAGEILVNSIDRDGCLSGYDLNLINQVRKSVSIPITVLGGAANNRDISRLIQHYGVIGAAAGSMFVLRGKYRAVLIQYPTRKEKESMLSTCISTGNCQNA
jgi:cyclase